MKVVSSKRREFSLSLKTQRRAGRKLGGKWLVERESVHDQADQLHFHWQLYVHSLFGGNSKRKKALQLQLHLHVQSELRKVKLK